MIKVLEKAIEKIRSLDTERQAYAAHVLEEIASCDPFEIPEEHMTAVLEGLEQVRRGERASDSDMFALWTKCGL